MLSDGGTNSKGKEEASFIFLHFFRNGSWEVPLPPPPPPPPPPQTQQQHRTVNSDEQHGSDDTVSSSSSSSSGGGGSSSSTSGGAASAEGGSGSTDAWQWQLHDLDYWSMTQRATAVQPGAKSVTIKVGSEAPISPGVPTGVNIVLVRGGWGVGAH
jgi:hypothetical protein